MKKSVYRQFKDALDLSKSKEHKIHKPIFRIALFLIFALFVSCVLIDGFSVITGSYYAYCPDDQVYPCKNPFYDDKSPICLNYSCDELLYPGESIGEEPSFLSSYFFFFVLIILILAVVSNKIYWRGKA